MDEVTRAALLLLLERGEITMAEASDLAMVNRSSILKMCRRAGFDPIERRLAYLRRRFDRTTAVLQGEEMNRPSKSEISARAAVLVKRWEDDGRPKPRRLRERDKGGQ